MKTAIISGPHFVTEALFGIGLSYGLTSGIENVKDLERAECYDRLMQIARGLAHKPGGGHNKFLETITLTLDVKAPRYWWQEFDTYRVGVTKQSESTMHTLMTRPFSIQDFEDGEEIVGGFVTVLERARKAYVELQSMCKVVDMESQKDEMLCMIKKILPECYLQRRIICLNAKALQNMYTQRKDHRLPEWRSFFDAIKEQMPGMMYGQFVSYCIFGGADA